VTFERPFTIADELLPAGRYVVEVEEELLDTMSVTAYRRIATSIRRDLPGMTSWIAVSPVQLDAAIARDAIAGDGASSGETPPIRG
jgi:hypothetical protein